MKEVLKYIGAVLFILLLLVKASAFHIYEHHDALNGQDNQCEYCLLAIDSQQSDILFVYADNIDDNVLALFHHEKITSVDFQVNLNPSKTEQLPRPPPSTL